MSCCEQPQSLNELCCTNNVIISSSANQPLHKVTDPGPSNSSVNVMERLDSGRANHSASFRCEHQNRRENKSKLQHSCDETKTEASLTTEMPRKRVTRISYFSVKGQCSPFGRLFLCHIGGATKSFTSNGGERMTSQ